MVQERSEALCFEKCRGASLGSRAATLPPGHGSCFTGFPRGALQGEADLSRGRCSWAAPGFRPQCRVQPLCTRGTAAILNLVLLYVMLLHGPQAEVSAWRFFTWSSGLKGQVWEPLPQTPSEQVKLDEAQRKKKKG